MKRYSSWFPWAVAVLAAGYLLMQGIAPSESGLMRLQEFAKLPVVYQGRLKPLDTMARNSLMAMSNRQTLVDQKGKTQPAIRWLLDVMSGREIAEGQSIAEQYQVFRIDNDEVLKVLGLEARDGFRYSIDEFRDKLGVLEEQTHLAHDAPEASRTLYQRKLLGLAEQLRLYISLSRLETPHLVPPESAGDEWKPFIEAAREYRMTGKLNPAARTFATILSTYKEEDAPAFNTAVAEYRADLVARMPTEISRADFEVFFNRLEPFYNCSILYVVAFLLGCLAWLGWAEQLNRAAFWLLLPTLLMHTFALGARMYLQGRPPVTNLYSSAIFIGWGCVVLARILESIYHNGIGNLLAGVTGFLTLLVAHNLGSEGDTLEMMQAVLDTNFWLATHVTCVTTGYASTFVAGFLGILFILFGVFTEILDDDMSKALGRMIYGIVCFATFMSFTGTVLGGIWADQSWGRFWGWDPKENGALMIVIWNALILHARWGGMVKRRGIAVLAVFGNIVTAWSWFGVNLLSVGLHSYGFMSGAQFWLLAFVASQLFLIGIGLLPMSLWRSFEPVEVKSKTKSQRVPSAAASVT